MLAMCAAIGWQRTPADSRAEQLAVCWNIGALPHIQMQVEYTLANKPSMFGIPISYSFLLEILKRKVYLIFDRDIYE